MTVETVFDIFLEEVRMKDIVIGTNGGTVTEVGTSGLAQGGTFTVYGVVDVPASTQAQAEEGTNDTTAMTPLRVKEAITAQRLWTLTGSNISYDAGTVTIGSLGLRQNLHVHGIPMVHAEDASQIARMTIGYERTGLGASYLDFISDTSINQYGMRIFRGAGQNGNATIYNKGSGEIKLRHEGTGAISFYTRNATRAFITSEGDVGIGTRTPEAKLEVVGKTKTTDLQVYTFIQPVIDQVLKAVDTEGNVSWQDDTFISHADTPETYSTKKKFVVKVNSAENGLVFLDPSGFPVKCVEATGIAKGQAFRVTGWNAGENAQEIALADQIDHIANGVLNKNMADGDFLDDGGVGLGVIEGTATDLLDTSIWLVGTILYVDGLGDLTSTEPISGNSQPIALVLRQHATLGTLQISAQYPKQTASDVRFEPLDSIVSTDVQGAITEVAVAGGGWSEWVASHSYVVGDRVTHEDIPYVCLADNSDAAFINSNWVLYSSIKNVDMVDPDGSGVEQLYGSYTLPPTQNSVFTFVNEKTGINKTSLIRYQGVIEIIGDISEIQTAGSTKGDFWISNSVVPIPLGHIGTLNENGYFYTEIDLAPGTPIGSNNSAVVDENEMHHLLSIDEDDMVSDEDRLVPTQQSTKAYVDKDLFREERQVVSEPTGLLQDDDNIWYVNYIPETKTKKLTGVTASGADLGSSIPHGLDASKILSCNVIVRVGDMNISPTHTANSGYHFDSYFKSIDVTVWNLADSASIHSQPFTVLLTYEE